eukprot:GGOE01019995.1.p1 GENE.GGOE01019995.1~~GGOE01019995.1.p1  ORF type:complete len:341 (+),score=82.86 GGOE01019995.1:137-1024(+)
MFPMNPMMQPGLKGGLSFLGKGVPQFVPGGPIPHFAGKGFAPPAGLGTVLAIGSPLPPPGMKGSQFFGKGGPIVQQAALMRGGRGPLRGTTALGKRPLPANGDANAEKKFKPAEEVLVINPEKCDNCCSKEHTWEGCPQTWKCRLCGEAFHTALFCHKSEAATLVVENMPMVPANELVDLFKIFAKGGGLRVKGTVVCGTVLAADSPAFIVYGDQKCAEEAQKNIDKAILKEKVLKVDWAQELVKQKEKEKEQLETILGTKIDAEAAPREDEETPVEEKAIPLNVAKDEDDEEPV